MDFVLSERQKSIQWAATEFARGEFLPEQAKECDQAGQFPEALWKKACQLRMIGIHYPKEYGGLGLGLSETMLTTEALCRVDSSLGSALASVDLGSEIILRFGSREQKEKILSPLVKGEKCLGAALAESEDDRNVSQVSTVADKRGEEYVVQGTKRFVSNASLANHFLVLCRDPKEGMISLIVEREQPSANP